MLDDATEGVADDGGDVVVVSVARVVVIGDVIVYYADVADIVAAIATSFCCIVLDDVESTQS